MIFHDDDDRESFLGILAGVVAIFNWRIHAWVLMRKMGVTPSFFDFEAQAALRN